MKPQIVVLLAGLMLAPTNAGAQGITARQVVLQQKDLPHNPLVKAQTHSIEGYGPCGSAYQSNFGSGLTLGGGQTIYSAAYQCPSPDVAAQQFPGFAAFYEQYYHHSGWHYALLPTLKAGAHHAAWFNRGKLGATDMSGHAIQTSQITLVFQRDDFIVFLQVSYVGESLSAAEHTTERLGHLMNRRIVSA